MLSFLNQLSLAMLMHIARLWIPERRQGKLMEDFVLKQNLSLLNSGSLTYRHPGTSTTSAIDLSLSSFTVS